MGEDQKRVDIKELFLAAGLWDKFPCYRGRMEL
jgi:hypothetical protein